MQSRLIVRNFGPIEFVDLDLRNVNVFIGPQASGKSALAKLFTIFKAPRKMLYNQDGSIKRNPNESLKEPIDAFIEILEEYNITSFLKTDTEIVFNSELHSLTFKNGNLFYEPKLLNRIQLLETLKEKFSTNQSQIKQEIKYLFETFLQFRIKIRKILKENNDALIPIEKYNSFINLNENKFSEIVSILETIKEIESILSTSAALYIPSERNFINIVKNASLNLLLNNVPIPRHILSFGAEVEKATVKEIDLGFLHKNLVYKNINGEDRIFTDKENSIKLIESASGIQSVLPILIPVISHSRYHRSFVIEEPELNLFPLAQYELIKRLQSNRVDPYWEDDGSTHTYTTHSPYILSALNNLLYAFKVKVSHFDNKNNDEQFDTKDDLVNKIIPAHIDPDFFTAYQIDNGGAQSIFNRETGLIEDNYIDEASDKMADDFNALMELMK